MKPIDLYAREPESESRDINILRGCYYNHIPEIPDDLCTYFGDEAINRNDRVLIKIYKDFDFDGRRFWRLASVWFDNSPVMVIQNAGREGDDHRRRYVTSPVKYAEMILFIHSLCPTPEAGEMTDLAYEDEDVAGLVEFYGNHLEGFFERHRY